MGLSGELESMSLSPSMIDGILVLVFAEFLLLAALLIRRHRRDVLTALFLFLASGGLLMLGLRVVVAGGSEGVVMGVLAVSFPVHVAALVLGWRLISKHQA